MRLHRERLRRDRHERQIILWSLSDPIHQDLPHAARLLLVLRFLREQWEEQPHLCNGLLRATLQDLLRQWSVQYLGWVDKGFLDAVIELALHVRQQRLHLGKQTLL